MQIANAIIFGIIVIFGYLANPRNKTNQWYCIAGFLFWLGAVNEALMYEIIPFLEPSFGMINLHESFVPFYSVFTWMLYTLAMPSLLIALIYLSDSKNAYFKHMRLLKIFMYVPGLTLTFFLAPQLFGEYQYNSPSFWITYAVYNFSFSVAYAFIAIRSFCAGNNILLNKQKQRVMLIFLPMLFYWLISVFVPRLIYIFYPHDLNIKFFDLWQANVFIMIIVLFILIVWVLKDGFMGLKLVSQNYNWNTNMSFMSLINMNAEYSSHFLKSQIVNMHMSIYLLEEHYASTDSNGAVSEYLDVLTRSISSLENYFDRIKHHSQIIQLKDDMFYRLSYILNEAMLISLNRISEISTHIDIEQNIWIKCDKIHMIEVFVNVITNAVEAMCKNGTIEVTGKKEGSKYKLWFKDNGKGIDKGMLKNMFSPRISTKSKDKNSGLGLSYCKNVMIEHGGNISAKSIHGEGATIIITFPSRRVRVVSGEREAQNEQQNKISFSR